MKDEVILMGHGSGGFLTHQLIDQLFLKYFDNEILAEQGDSSILPGTTESLCFTTDSFVVNPIFFPGGNIGKLAVAGTVNDLAVSGAVPKYLSAGFILEEGLNIKELEKIVESMANEAKFANVKIVTGDTKVVNKGMADKIYINTSGIGILSKKNRHISSGSNIQVGDKIIINGPIAQHGMAIMALRNNLHLNADIQTDCASLNHMIAEVLDHQINIRFMRDATRGGLSTVLYELFQNQNFGIEIQEELVPVDPEVESMCELLGFDPFQVANEGVVLMVVAQNEAVKALDLMRMHKFGKRSVVIGEITNAHPGVGYLHTSIGGKRSIDLLSGELLPRIC